MLLINKQLIRLGRDSWGWILLIVAAKLVILLAMVAVVSVVSKLIGAIGGDSGVDIAGQIFVAFIAAIMGLLGSLGLSELKFRCTAGIRIKLRHRIYQKMLDLEMDYIVKMGTSNAVTASIDGIEALEKYYSDYLPDLIYCFIGPFVLFARIYSYSPYAAWVLLILAVTVVPANAVFKKLMSLLRTEYWDTFNSLNEYFLESLEGMTTLKLMNRDEEHARVIRDRSFGYYHMIVKTMRVSFYSTILTQAFIYGGMLWATLILVRSCAAGNIALSSAFYALMLAYSFFAPVKDLINTGHTAMNGVAAASNIFSFLDIVPSSVPVDPTRKTIDDTDGIVIDSVHFGYDPDREVIKGVSMKMPKGRTTALAGQSGCGKSTMVNLLMHFNDVSEGHIYLEGKDICSISHEELRKRISLVPQSTFIFSGTVRDNLLIVDPSLTDEKMIDAMKKVKLDALLEKDGLDTDVGEGGAKLSGGQRQKIGIARALLADTEYMIFDEATSNVDAGSEDDIWETIKELSGQKTLVIISHRLSTIRNADRIYVMKSGKVEEDGGHDELMAKGGIYAGMVSEQNILENYGRRQTA